MSAISLREFTTPDLFANYPFNFPTSDASQTSYLQNYCNALRSLRSQAGHLEQGAGIMLRQMTAIEHLYQQRLHAIIGNRYRFGQDWSVELDGVCAAQIAHFLEAAQSALAPKSFELLRYTNSWRQILLDCTHLKAVEGALCRRSRLHLLQTRVQNAPWAQLPRDLFGQIFANLEERDRGSVRATCSQWYVASNATITALKPVRALLDLGFTFTNLRMLDLTDCRAGRCDALDTCLPSGLTYLRLAGSFVPDIELRKLHPLMELKAFACGSMAITDNGVQHLRLLTKLKVLHIPQARRLTQFAVATFAQMPRLQELHFNATHLLQGQETSLKRLTHLTALQVDFDVLMTNRAKQALKSLVQLAKLGVSLGATNDATLFSLQSIKPLRSLALYSIAEVSRNGLAQLRELTGLTELELHAARIDDFAMHSIHTLPDLVRLHVRPANRLRTNGYWAIGQLETLTHLHLTSSRREVLSAQRLLQCVNLIALQELHLEGWHFDLKALSVPFSALPELKALELIAGAMDVDGQLSDLSKLKQLTRLSLRGFALSDFGIHGLVQLKSLKRLELLDCAPLTLHQIAHLTTLTRLSTLDLRCDHYGRELRDLDALSTKQVRVLC